MSDEPTSGPGHAELFERLGAAASIQQVFGEPITRGDRTVIPMTAVSHAFYGSGCGHGGVTAPNGGSSRLSTRPVGAIELDADGLHIHTITDRTRLVTIALLVSAWNVFWICRALRKSSDDP